MSGAEPTDSGTPGGTSSLNAENLTGAALGKGLDGLIASRIRAVTCLP